MKKVYERPVPLGFILLIYGILLVASIIITMVMVKGDIL